MKYRREKSIRTSIRRTNKMEEQTEMTFWDHLEALRWMILRCLIALAVFLAAGFFFMPYLFEHVVMAPCRDDFFLYRAIAGLASHTSVVPEFLNKPFHVEVINIKLSSQLFMHFTLSFWLAFLCTFPYLVYEVWKFICPALYSNEKRGIRAAFLFGTVMFFIGCAVGYAIVFPMTLRFLYTYQLSPDISNQLALDSYMDNFLMLIFMMGIVFELPLVSMLLSRLGILYRSFFSKYRRHAIVAIMILSAVITPSTDPFTLMVVFVPIYILWELSAFLVRAKKK